MKTLSQLLCAFLVCYGTIALFVTLNLAGLVLMVIGSLAFIIISMPTKKITGYNPNSWMNK